MVKKLVALASVLTVFLIFAPLNVFSASDSVVINEVQIAGANTDDDFIELYNMSDSDYDLTGHRLVKRTASGSSDSSIKAFENGTTIPAHSYYLWANKDWDPGVVPDATTGATLAANNGIALRNGPADTGVIVDSVAWGTVTNAFVETASYPDNPDANTSIERNGDDTDNNSVDFVLNISPNPHNSSVSETPSPSASPSPTPTESPTPSPSASPSSTPTESPSPSASPSPLPTESPTPEPSLTPTPTSTPRVVFLGAFSFGQKQKYCFLTYKQFKFGLGNFWFPKVKCVNL